MFLVNKFSFFFLNQSINQYEHINQNDKNIRFLRRTRIWIRRMWIWTNICGYEWRIKNLKKVLQKIKNTTKLCSFLILLDLKKMQIIYILITLFCSFSLSLSLSLCLNEWEGAISIIYTIEMHIRLVLVSRIISLAPPLERLNTE